MYCGFCEEAAFLEIEEAANLKNWWVDAGRVRGGRWRAMVACLERWVCCS